MPGQAEAIVAEGLSKVYRLYQRPTYKLLDVVGLCPEGARYYTEHVALRDIDLRIGCGEKVAIIGRNGAGKSTLLKLITGIIRPTCGSVTTVGRISNLLQLGTGFHPEFTGRQNVYASLAHQGITGADADRLFEEVVTFAEIEEYVDQPMKTYSTGMCSRLMFSSVIVLRPDILAVDEVLGVGDAYFSHKSFERMRALCTEEGTTLLLVTHDIYSAMHLCDRFIWIDSGAVRFDGDGKAAVAMYETSIKEQEEHRLRQENAARIAQASEAVHIHVVVRTRTGFAPDSPIGLESIELIGRRGSTALAVADGAPGWHLVPEGNLAPRQTIAGRDCRTIATHGSIYHKAEWLVSTRGLGELTGARIRWRYEGADTVDFRAFTQRRCLLIAGELPAGPGWQEQMLTVSSGAPSALEPMKQTDYGTGLVRIHQVQFLDASGQHVVQVRHGESLTVRVHCEATAVVPGNAVTFVVGFARQGSPYAAHVYEPALQVPDARKFVVDATINPVRLGSGHWLVTLGIGQRNMFARDVVRYFTIDDGWYHYVGARLQIHIKGGREAEMKFYSRRLNDDTRAMPDLVEALSRAWKGGGSAARSTAARVAPGASYA